MLFRKIIFVLTFFTASFCCADQNTLMIVETNSLPPSDIFEASIHSGLSKCLNERCPLPEHLPEFIQKELRVSGYIKTPEDTFFSVQYHFNKNSPRNKLITSEFLATTDRVFNQYHHLDACSETLGIEEKNVISLSHRKLSRVDSALKIIFNGQDQGDGFFFIVVQPDLKNPGEKNIYNCMFFDSHSG